MALNGLIGPLLVWFETSSVLLNGPNLLGAAANPQGDDGLTRVGLRCPTADRSIQSSKQEDRGPALYVKFRRSVENDPRWRTLYSILRTRNYDFQRVRNACVAAQSRPARAVVADPPWAARAMNQPPGIYQQRIAVKRLSGRIRRQIGEFILRY